MPTASHLTFKLFVGPRNKNAQRLMDDITHRPTLPPCTPHLILARPKTSNRQMRMRALNRLDLTWTPKCHRGCSILNEGRGLWHTRNGYGNYTGMRRCVVLSINCTQLQVLGAGNIARCCVQLPIKCAQQQALCGGFGRSRQTHTRCCCCCACCGCCCCSSGNNPDRRCCCCRFCSCCCCNCNNCGCFFNNNNNNNVRCSCNNNCC